ncbi:MAG TPA: hypothetical protein DCL43_14175 [Chitinophagaceae bacterium]|nr:hypothetical protein [Chitinophagaceae bacterium]HAN37280.1 hypothetical protein [Chitinophagaceae bacterium]
MRQLLLIVSFVLAAAASYAQNDVLAFKKKDKLIQYFSTDNLLTCQLVGGTWVSGYVRKVKKDSITLQTFTVRQVPNYFGLPTLDTAFYAPIKFHYREIAALPLPGKRMSLTVGGILKVGALGYAVLNVINTVGQRGDVFAPENLTSLGIAALAFGLGILLDHLKPDKAVLGKKYELSYITMQPQSTNEKVQ